MQLRVASFFTLAIGSVLSTSCVTEVVSVEEIIRTPQLHAAEYRGAGVLEWAPYLASEDNVRRRRAIAALRQGGDEALPVLASLLEVQNDRVRDEAIQILASRGEAAVSVAVMAARSGDQRTRFYAARLLWTLTPDSLRALPALTELLRDSYWPAGVEAARAIAALGTEAASSTDALVEALQAPQWPTRRAAAGALAALGPLPGRACEALLRVLEDSNASVRRCAAEALGAIETQAARQAAVPKLVHSLRDDDVHVRVAAASALGALGEAAASAVPSLQMAARIDPAVAAEVSWALEQIAGPAPCLTEKVIAAETPVLPLEQASPNIWPMLGGSATRNALARRQSLPESWDLRTGRNVAWSTRLGKITYGSPVVADGVVYVGTDNEAPRDSRLTDKRGVLMAFDAIDGSFLWQDIDGPLPSGLENFLLETTTSSPLVVGDLLWYVTAGGRLRCLSTRGVRDVKGQRQNQELASDSGGKAELLWELDLRASLGVFVHEAPNCSVVAAGETLMVCTSNGVDEAHANIPAPHAPSFIGVNKRSGEVRWQAVGPSPRVTHGQWSSPCLGVVQGQMLAFFGGGDGRLYALNAATGEEAWQFDGNPPDAVARARNEHPSLTSRNEIIACPVFDRGRVYVTLGQDPNHGKGRGAIHALAVDSAAKDGFRPLWQYREVGRSITTPVVHEGLLYAADLNGLIHCVDTETGHRVWAHDLMAAVWSALLLVDNKLYVGDEDGIVTVLAAGRVKQSLARIEMNAPIWSSFAVARDVLYVATSRQLHAVRSDGATTPGTRAAHSPAGALGGSSGEE